MSRRPGRRALYGGYSAMFLAIFALIWGPMVLAGKEFIWSIDGALQHYPFLVYEGQWLREIVSSVLSGTPSIPLWEPAMGYGADVITTIGAYIGDPLNLLSVFFGAHGCETLFSVLVTFRLYLAGLAFVGYMTSRGHERYAVLLGAASYTFCGWASVTFNHPFFVYPLLFFPLILWGADRIIEQGRPVLFILSIAGLFLTYFYFGYMACLALIPYCLYRVRRRAGRWSLGIVLRQALRCVACLLVGLAISAIVLVPIIHVVLGSDRIGLERSTPALYPLWIYPALLAGGGGIVNLNKDTYWGVSAVCLLALVALFTQKGNRELKIAFVALCLGAILPVFGKVMNGFAYYAERWIWIFTLFLAYVQVRFTPQMLRPSRACRIGMAVLAVALMGCGLIIQRYSNFFIFPASAVANALVLAYVLALCALPKLGERTRRRMLAALAVSCVIVANLGFWYFGWSTGTGRQAESLDVGAGYDAHLGDTATSAMLDMPDDGSSRYDISISVPRTQNSDAVLGLRSANFYSSIYSNGVDTFDSAMGITSDILNHRVLELRGRSALEGFLNMRYFMCPVGQEQQLPYGCAHTPVHTKTVDGVTYGIYENSLALPTARLYPRETLSTSDFYRMSLSERQASLLSTVTLEDGASTNIPNDGHASPSAHELPASWQATSPDVTVEDGGRRFVVRQAGATATLSFPAAEQTETHVELTGLRYSSQLPEEGAAGGVTGILKGIWRSVSGNANEEYSLEFRTSDGIFDNVYGYTPDSHLYGGKHDWLVNLGYSPSGKTEASVTFTKPGVYTLDSIRVVAESGDDLERAASQTAENPVELDAFTNGYAAAFDAREASQLLFVIPWSQGWSATLDGKPVDIQKADLAFMAVEVPAGSHRIELRYETPWLKTGAALSAAGLLALGAIALWGHLGKRQVSREGSHFLR